MQADLLRSAAPKRVSCQLIVFFRKQLRRSPVGIGKKTASWQLTRLGAALLSKSTPVWASQSCSRKADSLGKILTRLRAALLSKSDGLEIEPRFPAKPLRRKSVPNSLPSTYHIYITIINTYLLFINIYIYTFIYLFIYIYRYVIRT